MWNKLQKEEQSYNFPLNFKRICIIWITFWIKYDKICEILNQWINSMD